MMLAAAARGGVGCRQMKLGAAARGEVGCRQMTLAAAARGEVGCRQMMLAAAARGEIAGWKLRFSYLFKSHYTRCQFTDMCQVGVALFCPI